MRDLNRENGEIVLTPVLSGRKSRRRTVYVGQAARKALWRYLTNRSEKRLDGPLIATQNGHEMDRNTIRQLISRLGHKRSFLNFVFFGEPKKPPPVGPWRLFWIGSYNIWGCVLIRS